MFQGCTECRYARCSISPGYKLKGGIVYQVRSLQVAFTSSA